MQSSGDRPDPAKALWMLHPMRIHRDNLNSACQIRERSMPAQVIPAMVVRLGWEERIPAQGARVREAVTNTRGPLE